MMAFGALDSREEEVQTGPGLWKAMVRDGTISCKMLATKI